MSQAPTPYTRQNDFVADATNNPNIGVSGIASDLDAEYEAIRTSVNQTISRLNEIQRNDGLLRSSVLDPAEYTAINAAVTGATDATNAAVAAASSASSAATSAANASANATTATGAATDTVGYKNLAVAAATDADASRVSAGNAAASADASRALAAVSEGNAAAHKNAASAFAVTASTKATEASASAATAATDAATATTKASEAQASSLSALASRDAAAASEVAAGASASAAASSAVLAADSAVSAANSAAISTTNADIANQIASDVEHYEEFLNLYLGAKPGDPATDNDGEALLIGAMYYRTTGTPHVRLWNGVTWEEVTGPAGISAYDIAVLNGFVGTEEQWLASLSAGLTASEIVTLLGYTPAVDVHTHVAADITDFAALASASAPVQSVAGMVGAVTLTSSDVGLGNVDNTSDADKPISTATAAALAGKLSSVGVLTDALTGDGVTTAFTLSAVTAAPFVTVFIDGVYQHKATYVVSGNTLTFSAAPPNGAAIDVNILQAS